MECYETCVDKGNKCAITKRKISCIKCGKLKPYLNLPRDICNICPSRSACCCAPENLTRRNTCRCERTCWQWFLNLFGLGQKLPECCKQAAQVANKTYQAVSSRITDDPCEPLKLKVSKSKEGHVTPCQRFGARTRSFICERSSRTSFQDLTETCQDSYRSIYQDEHSQSQKKESRQEEPTPVEPAVVKDIIDIPQKTLSNTSATRGREKSRRTGKGKGRKSKSRSSSRDKVGVKKTSSSSSTGSRRGKVRKTTSSSSNKGKSPRSRSPSLCSSSRLFRKSCTVCPSATVAVCPGDSLKASCLTCTPSPCCRAVCNPSPSSTDKQSPCRATFPIKRSSSMSCPSCYLGCYTCDRSICPCFSCRGCSTKRSCCSFSPYSTFCPSSCSISCKLPCRSQSFHSTLLRSPSPVPVCVPGTCGPVCVSPCGRSRCRLPRSLCPIVCPTRKSRSCPRSCLCPIKSSYCSPPPCCRSCCPKPSTHPYVTRRNLCSPGCCRPCCKPAVSSCSPCCTKPCCLPCPRSFSVYPYCPRPRQYRVLSSIPRCVTGNSCPCPPGRCSCPSPTARPFPKPCCSVGCAKPTCKPLCCTSNASSYLKSKQDDAVCQLLISRYSYSKPLCKPCPFPCFGGASCVAPGSICNPGGGCKSCVPCQDQRSTPKGSEPCDCTHSRKPLSPDCKSPKEHPIRFTNIPCSRAPLCEFILPPHCIRKTGPRSPVGEFLAYAKVPKKVKRKKEPEPTAQAETLSSKTQTQMGKETELANPGAQGSTDQPKKARKGKKRKTKKGATNVNESAQEQNDPLEFSDILHAEAAPVEAVDNCSQDTTVDDLPQVEESFNNNYGDVSGDSGGGEMSFQIDFTDMQGPQAGGSQTVGESQSLCATNSPTTESGSHCGQSWAHMYSSSNTSFDLQAALNTHRDVFDYHDPKFLKHSVYSSPSMSNQNVNAWDPAMDTQSPHRRSVARPVISMQTYPRYSAHPYLEQEINQKIQQIKEKQKGTAPQRQRRPHEGRRATISPGSLKQVVDLEFIRESWERLKERATIREKEKIKMKNMGLTEEEIEDIIANAEPERGSDSREQSEKKAVPTSPKSTEIVSGAHDETKQPSPQRSAGLKSAQDSQEQGDSIATGNQQAGTLSPRGKESSVDAEPHQLGRKTQENKDMSAGSKTSVRKCNSSRTSVSQSSERVPVFQSLFDRFEETVQIFVRTKSGESQVNDDHVQEIPESQPPPQTPEPDECAEGDVSKNKWVDSQDWTPAAHTSPPVKPVAVSSSPEVPPSLLTACSCQTCMTPNTSSTSVINTASRSGYLDPRNHFVSESTDTFIPSRADFTLDLDMPCLPVVESGSLSPGSRCFYAQDRSGNSADAEDPAYEYPMRKETSPFACGDLAELKRPFISTSKESSVDLADYTGEAACKVLMAATTAGSSVDPVQTVEVATDKQVSLNSVIQQTSGPMFQKVEDNGDVEAIMSAKAAFFNKLKTFQENVGAAPAKGSASQEPTTRMSKLTGKVKKREVKHPPAEMSQVMIDYIRTYGTPV